jgi:hypothetical protein
MKSLVLHTVIRWNTTHLLGRLKGRENIRTVYTCRIGHYAPAGEVDRTGKCQATVHGDWVEHYVLSDKIERTRKYQNRSHLSNRTLRTL